MASVGANQIISFSMRMEIEADTLALEQLSNLTLTNTITVKCKKVVWI